MLGNKLDYYSGRKVTTEEGYDFAFKNNYIFMETSCLFNINIIDVFENAIIEAHLIINRLNMKVDSIKNNYIDIRNALKEGKSRNSSKNSVIKRTHSLPNFVLEKNRNNEKNEKNKCLII